MSLHDIVLIFAAKCLIHKEWSTSHPKHHIKGRVMFCLNETWLSQHWPGYVRVHIAHFNILTKSCLKLFGFATVSHCLLLLLLALRSLVSSNWKPNFVNFAAEIFQYLFGCCKSGTGHVLCTSIVPQNTRPLSNKLGNIWTRTKQQQNIGSSETLDLEFRDMAGSKTDWKMFIVLSELNKVKLTLYFLSLRQNSFSPTYSKHCSI